MHTLPVQQPSCPFLRHSGERKYVQGSDVLPTKRDAGDQQEGRCWRPANRVYFRIWWISFLAGILLGFVCTAVVRGVSPRKRADVRCGHMFEPDLGGVGHEKRESRTTFICSYVMLTREECTGEKVRSQLA